MIDRNRRGLRLILAVLVALVAGSWTAAPVSAHTDFESSTPADGSVVDTPVNEIVLTFTSAATEAGDGFQVLDAAGRIRTPSEVLIENGRTFRLRFAPPLADGVIGVRWSVRAGDAHPIAGSFSFTVDAPTPAAGPTSSPATTVLDASSPASDDGVATETGSDQNTLEPAATETGDSASSTPAGAATGGTAQDDRHDTGRVAAADGDSSGSGTTAVLADFLAVDDEPDGAGVARAGRVIGFIGVIIGLGVLAFASAVLVGTRREVIGVVRGAQFFAAAIAVGASVEYVGVSRLLDETLTGAWTTSAGFATVLRLIGGVLIVVGLWLGGGVRVERSRSPAVALSAGVLTPDPTEVAPSDLERRARWRPDRRSWPVAVGALAVVTSFWFDGHTVTRGFRPLHALANSVHVTAGAVWAGGVAALAAVAWMRRRAGRPRRFGELVVRFSSIATVALVAVALAGVAMAAMIIDSPGDLTGTPWGRLLVLKLAAVAIAVGFGAYNHVRLRPALETDPDDPELLLVVRNILTAEAIVLTFVVVVTAWLVAAAS